MKRLLVLVFACASMGPLLAFGKRPDLPHDLSENDIEPEDSIREIVVTGTNHASNASRIPYSISKIGQQKLENSGSTQLLAALAGMVPGMFVTERNTFGFGMSTGGSGSIKIRGVGGQTSNSQVLVMVDGKPQFAGVFSHPIADCYKTEFVDRVEVVRGPASVLYGSNAMGGAINVITKNPAEEGSHTAASLQYGMFNTLQTSATHATRSGKFSLLASGSYNRTDGTQKHFDFEQESGLAKLAYNASPHWTWKGDYFLMNYVGHDPIFAKLENPEASDIYLQHITRGEASLDAQYSYEEVDGEIRGCYGHGSHRIEDPKPFEMKDRRLGLQAFLNGHLWEEGSWCIGFDFDRYSGEIPLSGGLTRQEAPLATMREKGIAEYAPYVDVAQGFWRDATRSGQPLLTVSAGLRMANSNLFGTHWIPQGGCSVNPGHGWTLKASAGKGFRNPSFRELYLYKMANPDLEPENMMNYEMGVARHFGHFLSIELTGFYIVGSDLIQSVFDADKGHPYNTNTGAFRHKGAEVSLASQPTKTLELRGTYSFLDSDIEDLTGAPRHMYSLLADWNAMPRLVLNASLTGVGQLYVAADVPRQNYALIDLKATFRATPFLDVFLVGENLTDARYCILKGYTMPGATVAGGAKIRF